jgi:two-component system chemotaxis response regulator CheY
MEEEQRQSSKSLPIVLIVDDNPAIRNVVAWSLQFGGYEPAEVSDGLEAIKWMEQAAREQRYPSAILLDLAMNGMSGPAFLEWMQGSWRPRYPVPAIIIVTASHIDEQRLTHFAFVKQVVSKPFHPRDLLEIIRRIPISS